MDKRRVSEEEGEEKEDDIECNNDNIIIMECFGTGSSGEATKSAGS